MPHDVKSIFAEYFARVYFFVTIRMFSCNGEEVKRLQFRNGGNYTGVLREGSFEMFGERVIKLGTNMYVLLHTVLTTIDLPGLTPTETTKFSTISSTVVNGHIL